ncbi:DUF2934 domain-containing protein [Rhizobium sp. C1]|uniref:DUF2934 domain-containing protein n=1 Tax=Rhizobium sp. C1 TaxID=1349799 RepID=UPI001E5CC07E|nr:DUF2934 domain-containing protein [Rhizobium sp. C1]MCD2177895.1 DUF2934 domain-containing protein [Rhizobium sp. C1]
MEQRSREEYIRERAYQIWEKEGRPDGHHDRHWQQAAEEWSTAEAAYHQGGSASGDQGASNGADELAAKVRDLDNPAPANNAKQPEQEVDLPKMRKSA